MYSKKKKKKEKKKEKEKKEKHEKETKTDRERGEAYNSGKKTDLCFDLVLAASYQSSNIPLPLPPRPSFFSSSLLLHLTSWIELASLGLAGLLCVTNPLYKERNLPLNFPFNLNVFWISIPLSICEYNDI
jgi:hypothetical protein